MPEPTEGVLPCQVCRRAPSRWFTVLGLSSLVIWFWVWSEGGFFCRTCALAVQRRMLARTLATAWFGIGVVFLPGWLVAFAVGQRRIRRLGHPGRAPYGEPPGRPLDPGRPVLLRAEMLVPGAI